MNLDISSPKLTPSTSRRWYKYYAGFSTNFVDDVMGELFGGRQTLNILDPWMGSGTTLSVAASRGHTAIGLDLNPAMVVVAKGRLIAADTETSLTALAKDIVARWVVKEVDKLDPLSQWFEATTTKYIRAGANIIQNMLATPSESARQKVVEMSSLAAFFYVALFETVSGSLRSFGSRNPTWIKHSGIGMGNVSVEPQLLKDRFLSTVNRLVQHLEETNYLDITARNHARVKLGDSRSLDIEDGSMDVVLTSPPYLTRLDYVVGHLPELALLGLGPAEVKELRQKMIGTPTMGSSRSSSAIGSVAEGVLQAVHAHDSYAAKSYYEPNFRQYFEGMSDSISELSRVVRDSGDLLVVVQDSWFKGYRLDLAACIVGIASEHGWSLVGSKAFTSVRSMVQINPKASEMARKSKPVESVLHFKK